MKYQVSLYYENIVRETWEVDADNEEEAKEKAIRGEGESQGEKVVSGERICDVTEVEALSEEQGG